MFITAHTVLLLPSLFQVQNAYYFSFSFAGIVSSNSPCKTGTNAKGEKKNPLRLLHLGAQNFRPILGLWYLSRIGYLSPIKTPYTSPISTRPFFQRSRSIHRSVASPSRPIMSHPSPLYIPPPPSHKSIPTPCRNASTSSSLVANSSLLNLSIRA